MITPPASSAAEITHQFVADLPEELAEAIRAAAIAHWFDAEFIAATILDVSAEHAQKLLAVLPLMPLVQPLGKGQFALHELARHTLLADLWQRRREQYQTWSERAANYSALGTVMYW